MSNQAGNSTAMNLLIGASLVLNITYMSMKFYKMYQDRKKKGNCNCKENKG